MKSSTYIIAQNAATHPGTFIELPAGNLKIHQGDRRKTIEKKGRKRQVWIEFCPLSTHKLAAINYEYN